MLERFGDGKGAQQRMRVDQQFRRNAAERAEFRHQFVAGYLNTGTGQQRSQSRRVRIRITDFANECFGDARREQHAAPLIETETRRIAERHDRPDLGARHRSQRIRREMMHRTE